MPKLLIEIGAFGGLGFLVFIALNLLTWAI